MLQSNLIPQTSTGNPSAGPVFTVYPSSLIPQANTVQSSASTIVFNYTK